MGFLKETKSLEKLERKRKDRSTRAMRARGRNEGSFVIRAPFAQSVASTCSEELSVHPQHPYVSAEEGRKRVLVPPFSRCSLSFILPAPPLPSTPHREVETHSHFLRTSPLDTLPLIPPLPPPSFDRPDFATSPLLPPSSAALTLRSNEVTMAPVPHLPVPNAHTIHPSAFPNSKDHPHGIAFAEGFGDGDDSRWPAQVEGMSLLSNEHEKQRIWRRTAGEMLAKDLGVWDSKFLLFLSPFQLMLTLALIAQNQHWILENLPTGYGLFQQTTHPKPDSVAAREGGKGKVRLDRFIFGAFLFSCSPPSRTNPLPAGHNSRKIRSAVSLGKHLSWLLFGRISHCNCDGCKVAAPRPSLAATGAEAGNPVKVGTRKRRRTSDYEAAVAASFGGDGDDEDGDYVEEEGSPRSARGGGGRRKAQKEESLPPAKKRAGPSPPLPSNDNFYATVAPLPLPPAGAIPSYLPPVPAAAAAPAPKRPRASAAKKKSRNEWENDDGEDDPILYGDPYTARGDGSGDEDEDWAEYGKVSVGGRTSSGRRSKPSTKALSGLQQEDVVATLTDDFAASMDPATADVLAASSTVPAEQVQQDLSFPSLLRVGELVWVRVPLGPPPQGSLANAQLSRWPGIVRKRTIVVTPSSSSSASNGAVEEQYRVELLGMSSLDTLEGVRGENVTPWVGYIPANIEYLDGKEGWRPPLSGTAKEEKKRWGDIQAEGWEGVAEAFRKAHRIAKAYSAIQVRP
jgi:hypothetical protein